MVGSIERVLVALGAAHVRYLVVGGVAVVMHGHLRTTADLDLVVELQPDNARRAIAALSALGLRPRPPVPAEAFADPAQRERWVAEKSMMVFSLWDPSDPTFDVDLFVTEPFDFEAAYRRRLEIAIGSTVATIVGVADLLDLKRAAGRSQDLSDIEALEQLGSASDEQ